MYSRCQSLPKKGKSRAKLKGCRKTERRCTLPVRRRWAGQRGGLHPDADWQRGLQDPPQDRAGARAHRVRRAGV